MAPLTKFLLQGDKGNIPNLLGKLHHMHQFWIEYNCPIGEIDERHRKNDKYKASSSENI
jgi:hypothetical protein